MSSIIDQLVFRDCDRFRREDEDDQNSRVFSVVFKNVAESQVETRVKQQWIQRKVIQREQFQTRIQRIKCNNSFIMTIRALEQSHYKKIKSKHQQILVLKQIAKRSSTIATQSTYFVLCDCLVMSVSFSFRKLAYNRVHFISQFFNRIINNNLRQFWIFSTKYLFYQSKALQPDYLPAFHLDLAASRTLSTTISNFGLSEQQAQYKYAKDRYELQQRQIDKLHQNIDKSQNFVKTIVTLFNVCPMQALPSWLKQNFMSFTEDKHKQLKPLLNLMRHKEDRKIEQFTYNMVKVQINSIVQKEIGEGGSSYVYIAKAYLTFINSTDHKMYLQNNQKIQKLIAIKKIKPGLKNKLKEKLKHQKQIVALLKSGTSFFIPKYYGTEQSLEISNSLLMQLVQGEELHDFLQKRQSFISLWSKLYLLLNIVQGVRHLIYYQIVHLDLKPANILVSRFLITKIIDFGQAYNRQVCDSSYCPGYTFPYAAPQVFQRFVLGTKNKNDEQAFQYSEKQDVFAFGIIMAEVLFNTKIFYLSVDSFKSLYLNKQILSRVYMAAEELSVYGEQAAISTLALIIVRCLDADPERRPYFDWVGISLKLILNSY